MIKSISYNQIEIIENIIKLHCSSSIQLDPTYGNGNFYTKGIQQPTYKFDLYPKFSSVKKADVRSLPLNSNSIETAMFDPPFLATTGKSLVGNDNNNIINKRFGVYDNEKALHEMYKNALTELYRVLKEKGILIFKCQDKISSGTQYLSHIFIINTAEKIGFYCKDLFILLAKNRLIANWQRNQKHARKFHSYFLVFQKINKKVKYTGAE